jgi:hypothetical protein
MVHEYYLHMRLAFLLNSLLSLKSYYHRLNCIPVCSLPRVYRKCRKMKSQRSVNCYTSVGKGPGGSKGRHFKGSSWCCDFTYWTFAERYAEETYWSGSWSGWASSEDLTVISQQGLCRPQRNQGKSIRGIGWRTLLWRCRYDSRSTSCTCGSKLVIDCWKDIIPHFLWRN